MTALSPTAFVDLDGVLVDYYAGVCRAFGVAEPWPYRCRPGEWDFFAGEPLNLTAAAVAPKMDREFYAGLDWLPDGRQLLAAVEERYGPGNVFLLSSPWDTPGCEDGKRAWVRRHLPGYAGRTLIGPCKEACAHPLAVLYDDSEDNCVKFRARFGSARLVPRPWNKLFAAADQRTGGVIPYFLGDMFPQTAATKTEAL